MNRNEKTTLEPDPFTMLHIKPWRIQSDVF